MPGRSLVVPNQMRALALRKAELWPVELRPQLRAEKACGWTHLAVSSCRFPSEQRIRRLIVASVSNKLILNKVAHESYSLLHKRDAAGLAVIQETQTRHKGYKPLTSCASHLTLPTFSTTIVPV